MGSSGDRQLSIAIGQVPLTLHFPEESLLQKASQRYSRFQAPFNNRDALPIYLEPGSAISPGPARFTYALHDAATVWLGSSRAQFRGVRHEYALDSLLRILLSMLLLPRDGFLLHAATVVRKGRAFVFTGRSGAGKSTVASLSPPGSVLTDEASLLRYSEGAWHAHGTPFWGEFRAEGANTKVPIAGIYALVQAQEDSVQPLSMKQALRALLPNVMFFSSGKQQNEELLRLLIRAAGQIPFYQLRFRRDPGFWQVVDP
jgi:hypothetical protein